MKIEFAKKVLELIELCCKSQKCSFRIKETLREGADAPVPFTKDRHVIGGYVIEHGKDENLVIFTEWTRGKNYLVVFDKQKNILCEVHELFDNDRSLRWNYRPAKRDEHNSARKNRFKEIMGSTEVILPVPSDDKSTELFLETVFKVAKARCEAENTQESNKLRAKNMDPGDNSNAKDDNEQTLNQILYGPPGTGKTYNTVTKAVGICDEWLPFCENHQKYEKKCPSCYKKIQERYKVLKEEGRIEFVTFHQSYGYEEFIEGIRANTDVESTISYDVEPGVFKRISGEASKNMGSKAIVKKDFLDVLHDAVITKIANGEQVKVKMTRSLYVITEVNERTIFFDKDKGESKHSLSIKTLRKIYDEGSNKVIVGGLQPYYEALLRYLNEYVQVPESLERKNYVLIIDEINRGNMSKIFGELITLIEDDKRLGAANEMMVRLPNSPDKAPFGVPNNLHIVATMNTADRSIAMMDTALRRRFEFEEMMPKASLLNGVIVEGVDIEKMLDTINQRIEVLYDREHTIGHAYFMPLKDKKKCNKGTLKSIFQNKVIPLLAEYFFEDWEKIRMVLGDNQKAKEQPFILAEKQTDSDLFFGQQLEYGEERIVYKRNPNALTNVQSYISIYQKLKEKNDKQETNGES